MWPTTDASNVPGSNPPTTNDLPPPSAGAEVLLKWMLATPLSEWSLARDDIQQEIYRYFTASKIGEAEFEQLTNLIHKRDQDVSRSGRNSSRSIGQTATAAVRFSRAAAMAEGNLPRDAARRTILSDAEKHERREKQGKRIYLAKVSIIAAEILRETRYPTAIQAVLARVVREVRNTGMCEQAIGTLAQESGASRRTVQMALRRAEEDGLIQVQARPRKPNRITIVSQKWLAWIATSINRAAEGIENHGVSSKGAEICTLPEENHKRLSYDQKMGAHRSRLSRESSSVSRPPKQLLQDVRGLKAAGCGSEPFEECLARLEEAVLAHSLFAAQPETVTINESEQGPSQQVFDNTGNGECGLADAEVGATIAVDNE